MGPREQNRVPPHPGTGQEIRKFHDRIQGWKYGREDSGHTAGCSHGLSNETNLEKLWRFTKRLMDDQRRDVLERLVLDIERLENITVLEKVLAGPTRHPRS